MPKLTIEERRIQTLRQQLQGKQVIQSFSQPKKDEDNSSKVSFSLPSTQTTTIHPIKDTTYLKNDLLKILILSTLAIGTQVLLLLASNNNLVNLSNLHI